LEWLNLIIHPRVIDTIRSGCLAVLGLVAFVMRSAFVVMNQELEGVVVSLLFIDFITVLHVCL
jgi:hypothetical protein